MHSMVRKFCPPQQRRTCTMALSPTQICPPHIVSVNTALTTYLRTTGKWDLTPLGSHYSNIWLKFRGDVSSLDKPSPPVYGTKNAPKLSYIHTCFETCNDGQKARMRQNCLELAIACHRASKWHNIMGNIVLYPLSRSLLHWGIPEHKLV